MNQEIEYINKDQIACEGNGPTTGHPKVFLDMTKKEEIVCPYCSKKFVKKR